MKSTSSNCLIVFASKKEAHFLPKTIKKDPYATILITGIGPRNTQFSFQKALAIYTPNFVLTCGFAGGLNPDHSIGTVLYETTSQFFNPAAFQKAKTIQGKFTHSDRILITSEEKQSLFKKKQADAVEMESKTIHLICKKQQIPCATIRVISDRADESLPIDYNQVMTPDFKVNLSKLTLTLIKSPYRIYSLIRFHKQTVFAANALARAIEQIIFNNGYRRNDRQSNDY